MYIKPYFRNFLTCFSLLLLSFCCGIAKTYCQETPSPTPEKSVIGRADQLPAHNYRVSGSVADLLTDEARFDALAGELESDLRADLEKYSIQDAATLKSYYNTLSLLALRKGDFDSALDYQERRRHLIDKPGPKFVTGIFERAWVAAKQSSGNDFKKSFGNALQKELNAIPFAQSQEDLKQLKSTFDLLSPNFIFGLAKNTIESTIQNNQISRAKAQAQDSVHRSGNSAVER